MDYIGIVFKVIDVPLVIGMVTFIQMLKRIIKIDSKWYALINIAMGFFVAWLKIDILEEGYKQFIIQGLIYSSANEFVYQNWRTIMSLVRKEKK